MGETAIDRSIDEAQRRRKDIFDTIFDKSEDNNGDWYGWNYYQNVSFSRLSYENNMNRADLEQDYILKNWYDG